MLVGWTMLGTFFFAFGLGWVVFRGGPSAELVRENERLLALRERKCDCKTLYFYQTAAFTDAYREHIVRAKPGGLLPIDNLDDIHPMIWHTCGK